MGGAGLTEELDYNNLLKKREPSKPARKTPKDSAKSQISRRREKQSTSNSLFLTQRLVDSELNIFGSTLESSQLKDFFNESDKQVATARNINVRSREGSIASGRSERSPMKFRGKYLEHVRRSNRGPSIEFLKRDPSPQNSILKTDGNLSSFLDKLNKEGNLQIMKKLRTADLKNLGGEQIVRQIRQSQDKSRNKFGLYNTPYSSRDPKKAHRKRELSKRSRKEEEAEHEKALRSGVVSLYHQSQQEDQRGRPRPSRSTSRSAVESRAEKKGPRDKSKTGRSDGQRQARHPIPLKRKHPQISKYAKRKLNDIQRGRGKQVVQNKTHRSAYMKAYNDSKQIEMKLRLKNQIQRDRHKRVIERFRKKNLAKARDEDKRSRLDRSDLSISVMKSVHERATPGKKNRVKYLENENLRAYVGKGNNMKLIEQLLRKRGWWRVITQEEAGGARQPAASREPRE